MSIALNGIISVPQVSFEMYRDLVGDVFEASAADSEQPFQTEVRAWQLDRMFLHHGRHPAVHYDRDAARTRSDGLDDIAVLAVARGQFEYASGDRCGVLGPGEAILIDRSRPFHLRSSENVQTTLNIPRDLLREIAAVDLAHAEKLHGSAGSLLASFMHAIGATGPGGTGSTRALLLLIEQAFAMQARRQEKSYPGPRSTIRQRAGEIIEASFSDPEFDVEALSRIIGVSRSSLYRAFAGDGVHAYLKARRIEHARYLLTSNPQLRVAEVAIRCGFKSNAVFSSQFKDRVGISPTEFRETGRSPARSEDAALEASARMQRWQHVLQSHIA